MNKIQVYSLAIFQFTKEKAQAFIDWTWRHRRTTEIHIAALGYPRAAMLIPQDDKGDAGYCLLHMPIMVEAYVPRPGSNDRVRVQSLKRIDEALMDLGKNLQSGCVYLYMPEGDIDYGRHIKKHGWREVENVRLYRKEIKD